MSNSGVSMIFFQKAAINLEDAAQLLENCGLAVDRQTTRLLVNDGPKLRIYLSRESHIKQEAQETGIGTPYSEFLNECDTRFEISFDDVDEVLDEINTLIEVQITLQSATQGVIFNSWNGQVFTSNETDT